MEEQLSNDEARLPAAGPERPRSSVALWFGRIISALVGLALLSGAAALAYYWMENRPQATRRPPQKQATLVEVRTVRSGEHRMRVRSLGTVVPAREVRLAAQVSGQVLSVAPDFEPGGLFQEGDELVMVDHADLTFAVAQRQGELTKAKSALKLESGQQSVARQEYEILRQDVPEGDEDLLLRRPQRDSAQASVAIAEASLGKAELDLERCVIRAPMNAVVQSRNVQPGSLVSSGTAVATLIGTDEYWVEAPVAVDDLARILIPSRDGGEGSAVKLYHEAAWGSAGSREGRVTRIKTDIEETGLQAVVLVSVPDPLHLDAREEAARPLILGLRVVVEIEGRAIADAVPVPWPALHEGNQVWVMSAEGTLDIRTVEVAWGDHEQILVTSGLEDGERIVVSDLGAPVQGMALRTESDAPASPGKGS